MLTQPTTEPPCSLKELEPGSQVEKLQGCPHPSSLLWACAREAW